MNIRPRHPRPLVALLVLTAVVTACQGAGARATTGGKRRAVASVTPAHAPMPFAYGSAHPDTVTPPVYYDLTRFDWYRRGQPLVADNLRYSPEGPLVSLTRDSLTMAGRYDGVVYYRAGHGDMDTVYVPVYRHYWLAFVHGGGRRAR